MAKTKISDVIVPEVFNPYVVQRTMELSALYNSGIISNNPELDRLASSGGTTINMPYWEDLNGDDEVLSDDGALTPAKITAGQDIAVLLMRGKAWSANDLAKALSGDDPMAAIGDLVAEYWARRMQATAIKLLDGAFAASNMTNKVLDISSLGDDKAKINGENFLDALQLMGDAKDKLTGVIMHSATETQLRKNNLIQTELDSNNKPISLFMEKRVIIDDSCPVSTGNYTTYLFGEGAIGLGNGGAPVPTETDRDSLAGDDILINRKHYILHPRGVKWIGSAAGSSPTNTELATGTNWSRVYEDKAIRMVKFVHKL
ncbi:major capsid protein [Clostridium neonatale]|uniref:Phage coat protein n=1 Tax=Clostridium neonatale TaxID=137838 RepID=A0AAD1YCQ3_9CLOT|nr:major capsid protein [Clostridium neonatale]CAG9719579.1 Putative phage coat protein [Clostridium neonatale]CAI3191992.1 putative phage coat protein [Clostridium neonatale]CAI3203696.1 putative phage coat protein [Clostridium neonatale]CAI3214233.1 putative phage coat protein [Clostridium neonatale]CAI3223894.1 putative phage coat protein [Clostridium neonatale]